VFRPYYFYCSTAQGCNSAFPIAAIRPDTLAMHSLSSTFSFFGIDMVTFQYVRNQSKPLDVNMIQKILSTLLGPAADGKRTDGALGLAHGSHRGGHIHLGRAHRRPEQVGPRADPLHGGQARAEDQLRRDEDEQDAHEGLFRFHQRIRRHILPRQAGTQIHQAPPSRRHFPVLATLPGRISHSPAGLLSRSSSPVSHSFHASRA